MDYILYLFIGWFFHRPGSPYKYLGTWIDKDVMLTKHMDELVKKLRFKAGRLKQIERSTFLPVFDYGDTV
jgi:hypothetical protein